MLPARVPNQRVESSFVIDELIDYRRHQYRGIEQRAHYSASSAAACRL